MLSCIYITPFHGDRDDILRPGPQDLLPSLARLGIPALGIGSAEQRDNAERPKQRALAASSDLRQRAWQEPAPRSPVHAQRKDRSGYKAVW